MAVDGELDNLVIKSIEDLKTSGACEKSSSSSSNRSFVRGETKLWGEHGDQFAFSSAILSEAIRNGAPVPGAPTLTAGEEKVVLKYVYSRQPFDTAELMVQLRKATFSKEVINAIFSTLSMTIRMGITGSTTAIAKAIFGRDDANLSDIGNALVQLGGGRADMVGLSSAMFVLDELGRNVVGLFPRAVGSFHQRLELLKRSIGDSEMADEIALMLMTIMIKELNQQTEAALRQGVILGHIAINDVLAQVESQVDRIMIRPYSYEKEAMEKFRSLAGKRALQTKVQSGQQATSNQGASAQGGQLKQIGQTKMMWDHCFDFQRKDGCKRANCDRKHVFVECERFKNSACRFNENTCRFKH